MHYYEKQNNQSKKRIKLFGGLLILFGFGCMFYFFFPVISYQMFIAHAYENDNIEVPVPKYLVADKEGGLGSLISQGISSLTTNYNDARNWYPSLTPQKNTEGITQSEKKIIDSYQISIPKLGIENAIVSTKDYDLTDHLVQYFGTALPGEQGTAVIFGHSTLPTWFDPKNYKTIFATLHKIKVDDTFSILIDGKTYNYKIFSIVVTTPEDVNILSQSFDNSYVTIVTCTPPGTIWKRLVVRAALES